MEFANQPTNQPTDQPTNNNNKANINKKVNMDCPACGKKTGSFHLRRGGEKVRIVRGVEILGRNESAVERTVYAKRGKCLCGGGCKRKDWNCPRIPSKKKGGDGSTQVICVGAWGSMDEDGHHVDLIALPIAGSASFVILPALEVYTKYKPLLTKVQGEEEGDNYKVFQIDREEDSDCKTIPFLLFSHGRLDKFVVGGVIRVNTRGRESSPAAEYSQTTAAALHMYDARIEPKREPYVLNMGIASDGKGTIAMCHGNRVCVVRRNDVGAMERKEIMVSGSLAGTPFFIGKEIFYIAKQGSGRWTLKSVEEEGNDVYNFGCISLDESKGLSLSRKQNGVLTLADAQKIYVLTDTHFPFQMWPVQAGRVTRVFTVKSVTCAIVEYPGGSGVMLNDVVYYVDAKVDSVAYDADTKWLYIASAAGDDGNGSRIKPQWAGGLKRPREEPEEILVQGRVFSMCFTRGCLFYASAATVHCRESGHSWTMDDIVVGLYHFDGDDVLVTTPMTAKIFSPSGEERWEITEMLNSKQCMGASLTEPILWNDDSKSDGRCDTCGAANFVYMNKYDFRILPYIGMYPGRREHRAQFKPVSLDQPCPCGAVGYSYGECHAKLHSSDAMTIQGNTTYSYACSGAFSRMVVIQHLLSPLGMRLTSEMFPKERNAEQHTNALKLLRQGNEKGYDPNFSAMVLYPKQCDKLSLANDRTLCHWHSEIPLQNNAIGELLMVPRGRGRLEPAGIVIRSKVDDEGRVLCRSDNYINIDYGW